MTTYIQRSIKRLMPVLFVLGLFLLAGGWAAQTADQPLAAAAPFVQRAKLFAADATVNNLFGDSVAMNGNTIIVGAPNTDVGDTRAQGAAYVYVRSGTAWVLEATLLANDGREEDMFGTAVTIDGDTAIVGAPWADLNPDCGPLGLACNEGAAYIFVRNGSTWTQQQKIVSTDPASSELFAFKVELENNTAVISEHLHDIPPVIDRGLVNVYTRSAGTFGLQQRLATGNPDLGLFGWSIDLDGDTIVAGASGGNTGGTVFVFVRGGTMWTLQQQLFASDAGPGKWFGFSVAVSGDTIIVGDNFDDIGSNNEQGSAYAFIRSGTVWSQRQKFTAGGGRAGDNFGDDVAVSGNTIVIASPSERVGVNDYQGSAYVYSYNGANWTEIQRLVASDGIENTLFGNSVLISGNSIVASAYNSADPGPTGEAGAAYVFETLASRAPFDFDGDGKSDVSVFRPSQGAWYILRSSDSQIQAATFGLSTDLITPADYDGDGRTDINVFRPSGGEWYWINSSNGTFQGARFGASGDIPVPADYDGDGRADLAVFRPANGTWYRINSLTKTVQTIQFGMLGDVPVPADFDGDDRADVNVFRKTDGTWHRINSINNGVVSTYFGLSGDLPVPADFDGDGRADISVFRPSNGTWYRINSTPGCVVISDRDATAASSAVQTPGCFVATQFGLPGDRPLIGDFNGDRRADVTVFRPSDNIWYRLNVTFPVSFVSTHFGANGDLPVPAAFVY